MPHCCQNVSLAHLGHPVTQFPDWCAGAKDEQLQPLLTGTALPNGHTHEADPNGAKSGSQPDDPAGQSGDEATALPGDGSGEGLPNQDAGGADATTARGEGEERDEGRATSEEEGADERERAGEAQQLHQQDWVVPVDELDNSDVEAAQVGCCWGLSSCSCDRLPHAPNPCALPALWDAGCLQLSTGILLCCYLSISDAVQFL